MARLTSSDVHGDKYMERFAIGYMGTNRKYIVGSGELTPIVDVKHSSDKYLVLEREDLLRIQAGERAMDAEAPLMVYGTDDGDYKTKEYAGATRLPWKVIRDSDNNAIVARQTRVKFCTEQIMRKVELDWASKYFNTGEWSVDVSTSSGDKWDASTADIVGQIGDRALVMERSTGFYPNTLILGRPVWPKVSQSSQMRAWVQRVGGGKGQLNATVSQFQQVLSEDAGHAIKVLVPNANYNASIRGVAADYQWVFGKGALLAYIDPNPGNHPVDLQPTACVTFRAPINGMKFYHAWWPRRESKGEHHESAVELAFAKVASDLGVFWTDVIA